MSDASLSRDEFRFALEEYAPRFCVRLDAHSTALLQDYYELLLRWNARLHLVAPCSPSEFAVRHVLESLLALDYMPEGARVIDVGSGGGLPIIPCLIVRADLSATLIESSQKKAVFLREALRSTESQTRAEVRAERFQELPAPRADALTCRAVDRFAEILPQLFEWSSSINSLLLFGGLDLCRQIEKLSSFYHAIQMPDSERRFLYVLKRG